MDAKNLTPAETVSASKKLSRKDAEEIARSASRVVVAKGKHVEVFETAG